MATWVCTVAPVLVLTSCVAVNQNATAAKVEPGEVQFDLVGPGGVALVVPAIINGEGPFPLVLDTGATLTCVDQRIAKQLELPDAVGTIGYGGGIRGMSSMRVVSIASIEVGTAKATGLKGCVVDLQPMEKAGLEVKGLLGLNFLKAYHVTIDFNKRSLRLERPEENNVTRN